MELKGIEPLTFCVQDRRSPNWATAPHKIDFIQNNYFLICSIYNALTISVYFIIFFIISFILYKYYIIKFYKNQIYRSVITKLLLP